MASNVKSRRVLVIMHEDLVPPTSVGSLTKEEVQAFRTEENVVTGLEALGHDVKMLGLYDELAPLRKALDEFRPHVVFNLLEEFHGEPVFDYHVVAYLELKRVAYTGCNSRGLMIGRDKALSKKILHYHRVRVPRFAVFPRRRNVKRPRGLTFPLIVKSLTEEASLGISQASVVHNDTTLAERVRFIHQSVKTDAIAEQYIAGRELYAAVIGNQRREVLPIWELDFSGLPKGVPRIATRKVKWDVAYQEKRDIYIDRAQNLDPATEDEIVRVSKRVCRRLGIDGYARIDYRLDDEGRLYFLEANPNPQIADGEEFASAADAAGMPYNDLLQRIVRIGIGRG